MRRREVIAGFIAAMWPLPLQSQQMVKPTPVAPRNAVLVGHSLVNHIMPQMLRLLGPKASTIRQHVINGSPMGWNWTHAAEAEGFNAKTALAAGGVEVLIIAEAGPVESHITYSDSFGLALRWRNLAVNNNPGVRTYMYQTWPENDITPGRTLAANWPAWRTEIDRLRPFWEAIARAGQMTGMVPAGNALAALYDAIHVAQDVPGLTSIAQVFSDDIHLNDLGNYFVACVMYASIYETSPAGLPVQLHGQYGEPYRAPTKAQALRFQQIAWTTVSTYDFPKT